MRNRIRVVRTIPFLAMALLVASPGAQTTGSRASAREKVVGGPYVVNVGPRSATVMWLVQTGQASLGAEPGKMEKDGSGAPRGEDRI